MPMPPACKSWLCATAAVTRGSRRRSRWKRSYLGHLCARVEWPDAATKLPGSGLSRGAGHRFWRPGKFEHGADDKPRIVWTTPAMELSSYFEDTALATSHASAESHNRTISGPIRLRVRGDAGAVSSRSLPPPASCFHLAVLGVGRAAHRSGAPPS